MYLFNKAVPKGCAWLHLILKCLRVMVWLTDDWEEGAFQHFLQRVLPTSTGSAKECAV